MSLFNLRTDKTCTNELKALLFTRFSLNNKHVNDSLHNGTSTYFFPETPFERNPKNTFALMEIKITGQVLNGYSGTIQ